jgi:hypothetical protein
MRRLAIALLCAAGCHSSKVQPCGESFVCPPALVCAPSQDACVRADQVTACSGKAAGAACSFSGAQAATCQSGVCTATLSSSLCGNRMLDPGETCDGAPPPGKSCLDYGLDAGRLGCSSACDVDISDCRKIGWAAMKAPVQDTMSIVWGTGPSDVWAAYSPGGLLHYDGSAWKDVPLPAGPQPVQALWGTGPTDLWVSLTANGTTLWHFDGTSWTAPVPVTTSAVAIWGSAKNDFFLSDGDHLYHCDGSTATLQYTRLMGNFRALWGSGPSDVFAAGTAGWVAHFDGNTWSDQMVGSFAAVWGFAPKDVYFGGPQGLSHYQGTSYVTIDLGNIVDIWGATPTDLFAIDEGMPFMPVYQLRHYDGTAWSAAGGSGHSIWGSSAHDVFLVGDGPIMHYQGSSWSTPTGLPPHTGVIAWWAGPATGLWLAGYSAIYQFNGFTWAPVVGPMPPGAPSAIWGTGGGNVYLVACDRAPCATSVSGSVNHFNGSSWHQEAIALLSSPIGIWGSGANDIYVTSKEYVSHFDGNGWSNINPMNESLAGAVWGTGPGDVFVATDFGARHFDGMTWAELPFPQMVTVAAGADAIFGTGATDVWFALKDGVAHWDGSTVKVTALPGNDLRAIWASAPDDAFAAGTTGTLLHYDGTGWTPVRTLSSASTVNALAGFGGQLWLGADDGPTELVRTAPKGP